MTRGFLSLARFIPGVIPSYIGLVQKLPVSYSFHYFHGVDPCLSPCILKYQLLLLLLHDLPCISVVIRPHIVIPPSLICPAVFGSRWACHYYLPGSFCSIPFHSVVIFSGPDKKRSFPLFSVTCCLIPVVVLVALFPGLLFFFFIYFPGFP